MTTQTVYRPAIRTYYDGPTSKRVAHTVATYINSTVGLVHLPWDNTKTAAENHRDAAEACASRANIAEPLVGGGFGQTYFWVHDTRPLPSMITATPACPF